MGMVVTILAPVLAVPGVSSTSAMCAFASMAVRETADGIRTVSIGRVSASLVTLRLILKHLRGPTMSGVVAQSVLIAAQGPHAPNAWEHVSYAQVHCHHLPNRSSGVGVSLVPVHFK